jgi:glycosyltransferase involved in cell wall biosynthesis
LPESVVSMPTLLVFADDWDRHPSSCQHLIRQLLARYQVYWVNTIGMRPPRMDWMTLHRGLEKARQWLRRRSKLAANGRLQGPVPRVLNPRMWPWFSAPLDRRINRALLARQLAPLLRPLHPAPVALTTIPIVADLVGALPVSRWVYYCVDDFSLWPGLDSGPLRRMEADLVAKVDQIVAVSETLRQKLRHMGRESELLTHGVELEFWRSPAAPPPLDGLERPLIVFWGAIDRRMDLQFLRRLAADLTQGSIVLAGPEADPDPALADIPRIHRLGSVPFGTLPGLARAAAALVMPYADLPVTRAMQPLKLKEYLATGQPVVVRDLPATAAWADCADVVSTPEAFSESVRLRLQTGIPEGQRQARARLVYESWAGKAAQLEQWALQDLPRQKPSALSGSGKPRVSTAAVVLETRVVRGSGGGPDKTILNTPRFLTPLGYRTVCAYLHPPADSGFERLREKARQWGARLFSVPDHGFWDLAVIPRMLNICRRERVTIWHGHDYKTNALGLILRRFWRMKLITTVHGWVHHTRRTPLYFWIDRRCLPHYDLVLCVSQDLYDRCLECGVTAERCVLLENAIDTDEFRRRTDRAEGKRRLGLPKERFIVGAVGRLSPEKGFDLLISAVEWLVRAGRDVGLVIVGEGDEKQRLENLIAERRLGDRCQLLGYRADVSDIYQALDVFALSSHREGLPNVLLEAMAFEVPVVATCIAGIPDLVRDGENGLLVKAGDADELAAALSRLHSDADLRSRVGTSARRTIEEHYSFRTRMAKVVQLYDRLLHRSSPPDNENAPNNSRT